jgi:hypothetical protein
MHACSMYIGKRSSKRTTPKPIIVKGARYFWILLIALKGTP